MGQKEDGQRRGPISEAEKEYITRMSITDSPERIAKHLHRNPDSVKKFLRANHLSAKDYRFMSAEDTDILHKLHGLPWWCESKDQFSTNEIALFESLWIRLFKQFDFDVLPSEEIQIRKYITFEILKNRSLSKIREHTLMAEKLEMEYRRELAVDKDLRDMAVVSQLKDELSAIKNSTPNLNREYMELCAKQEGVEKGLSASRNDRIKSIQDASKNWSSILRMLEDPRNRKEIGAYLEVMKAARDKEMARLTSLHKFVDGEYDRPILSGQLEENYVSRLDNNLTTEDFKDGEV
jgi:hypothetical protein